jgi:hypothetical protein
MSDRLDVRRMLLARGWAEQEGALVLSKGGAEWACTGCRDSALTARTTGRRTGNAPSWTVDFGADVPARVIVAMAEEAAEVSP